jgi:2-haloacid dehalogenase
MFASSPSWQLRHTQEMAEYLVASVVFDVGRVLLDHDPPRVYRELIPDPAELEWLPATVCTPEWNATLNVGHPFEEACWELAGRYPAHAERIYA